jgi:hypothetical protein
MHFRPEYVYGSSPVCKRFGEQAVMPAEVIGTLLREAAFSKWLLSVREIN